MNSFTISSNNFLRKDIPGFYGVYYLGYKKPDNPDYLNCLKNTFGSEPSYTLKHAKDQVLMQLRADIPGVMAARGLTSAVVCVVPRAKRFDHYSANQLMFAEAVSDFANAKIGLLDGTALIRRHTDTKTTHLARSKNVGVNDGAMPYPGITKETCSIGAVEGRDIILIDDIYTRTVNIVEDAIQALLDRGARSVTFYAVAYTKSNASII